MDEVQIYKRALDDKEIYEIYEAGSFGKCQDMCHVPWITPFCIGQMNATMHLTICNFSMQPASFDWDLQPQAANPPGCTVPGPSVFNPPQGTTSVLNPGDCASIPVTIHRPNGFNSGDVGCYVASIVNNTTGITAFCKGSIWGSFDWCGKSLLEAVAVVSPPDTTLPSDSVLVEFKVINTGDSTGVLPYEITAVSSDNDSSNQFISLDRLPPGVPVSGVLNLSPGDSTTIAVEAAIAEHQPFRLYDILLSADTDSDGKDEVLASAAVRSHLADDCNRNGIPDDLDIATGTSQDLDGNGIPDECEQVEAPSFCPDNIPTLTWWGCVIAVILLIALGIKMHKYSWNRS